MPYVKSISIHSTPKQSIAYILNKDKTDDLLYASGINCSADTETAYWEMKAVFEEYSKHQFNEKKAINSKTPVKLFHFVHSYSAKDEITPDQAHRAAQEWAVASFGKDRQIIVSTHLDKGHIHSHVIINPYDFNGKKYNSNKKTLEAVRELANSISLQYGIKPTVSGKNRKSISYKEWDEKKKGTSWKQAIREAIDRLIYESENLDELLRKLTEQGYEIRRKKYISIHSPTVGKSVRIKSLGEGYDEESLEQRIAVSLKQKSTENENKIDEQIANMSYMEKLYRRRIYEVSELVKRGEKVQKKYNPKLPYSVENDFEIFHLSRQLMIINRDGISSAKHLEIRLKETEKSYENCRQELNNLMKKQEQFKLIIDNSKLYFSLKKRPENELSQAEKLKLKISENIVLKCGIKSENDILAIQKVYAENEQKSAELEESFKRLEQRFREYTDIMERYKNISQKDYITRLVEEKKRKAGTLE